MSITRRKLFGDCLTCAAAALGGPAAARDPEDAAGDGIAPAERAAMDRAAFRFMQKFDVAAFSVAIALQDRLVYRRALGVIDRATNEEATPDHLFRIASVTKPITSTALFRLVERGRVTLSDPIFRSGGVLGSDYAQPVDPRVLSITIDHLLTHTAGGWTNDGRDPMFSNPTLDQRELIAWTLQNRPLDHEPGTVYAYSNFGYCILGRVIEKLTGKRYARAVEDLVLRPSGISGMRIAGDTPDRRAPNEVAYYCLNGGNPYAMRVSRMDSHGGWIARPTDLVTFLVRVDGIPLRPDILRPTTLQTMVTPTVVNPGYARGWCVNRVPNYWHDGSLPGTASIAVRTAGGFCWAALTNTGQPRSPINGDLDRLIWEMVGCVTRWPENDLFALAH